jgi:hypothetical protein
MIFGHHMCYVVPLFQRPYVWNLQDQWQPLWEDVRAVAESLPEAPVGYGTEPVPPHFLGAIVLDQQMNQAGFISVRHVIDGQQRLTTLQLLLDAAQKVVERHGAPMDAQALRVLVRNNPEIAQHPDEVFKVWPTDRDQTAFRAAMGGDTSPPQAVKKSRIAEAHDFFVEQITEWAEVEGDPGKAASRLNALVRVLREHLKVVVIDLEPGDNAQVIFETLNHRGSPLLAADLIKNLIFQLAQAQNADVEALYQDHWAPLDNEYWRQPIARGRRLRPRIDVFLNYWLTMKLQREVQADRVFNEFRDYIRTSQPQIPALLAELASDAEVYQEMESLPESTVEGIFHYRVIKALDSAVVGPFMLWLLRWEKVEMPLEQRHRALRALESWMVRRALCRATAKDVNRLVVELLQVMNDAGPAAAGDAVAKLLATQQADSRYWPDDYTLRTILHETPIYKDLTRPRLRMVLEAIEDSMPGPLSEGHSCPHNLTVEHVMPQSWREHWGTGVVGDLAAEFRRDKIVHLLGNLTLVNKKLNPAMSNRPWTGKEAAARGLGDQGKRDYLLEHSQLKLNARLIAQHPKMWTEDAIRTRTDLMIGLIAKIWPRPTTGALPAEARPTLASEPPSTTDQAGEGIGSTMQHAGKYRELWQWLLDQTQDSVSATFTDVEQIIGMPLPQSARDHLPHWYGYKGTALGRAIRDAGWRATQVNLIAESVTFVRDETAVVKEPES